MAEWQVLRLERPQPHPYYVARPIGEGQWEQLRDGKGALIRFETAEDATEAMQEVPHG